MSGFWRRWLTVWCWAVGVFGVVLVGGAFDATSLPTRLFFGLLNGPAPLDLDAQARFSLGVLGAVTLGWSLTLAAAIGAAIQLGEHGRPTWVMVTASALTWFVVDTPLSIATGYGLNALSNVVFLAAFLTPILASGVLRRA
jgi:hypothetical protein